MLRVAMRAAAEKQAKESKKTQKLNVSGEEAYIRRLRMSDPAAADKYEAELRAKQAAEGKQPPDASGANGESSAAPAAAASSSSSSSSAWSSSAPAPAAPAAAPSGEPPASMDMEPEPEPEPSPAPGLEKNSFAARMLKKMGWKAGQGLGKNQQGIASPLVPDGAFNKLTEVDKRTSSVMCILNMVGRGEVDPGLAQETIQECSRFGDVENCIVYQSQDPECPEDEAVVIYVKFVYDTDCEKAIHALNGRFFGGRKIKAMFYDEGLYEARDFT